MWAQSGSIRAAAAIARRQHGTITFAQLRGVRLSATTIGRWADHGLLHREFRGVYRLGHAAPSLLARYAAAVLACGDGAVLSGLAAARLLEILRRRHPAPPEVTVTANRRVEGIICRRARALEPQDVMRVKGIPCTTPARTLADLAGVLSLDALARTHHEAEVRWDLRPEHVLDVLARRSTTPGAADLHSVVIGDTPAILSRMEGAFVRLVRSQGFPKPVVNRPAGGHYVDCRWPEHRFIAELDSFRYHRTRTAWEADRQRDRDAAARGDELKRFTWHDIFVDQRHLLATLARFLPSK